MSFCFKAQNIIPKGVCLYGNNFKEVIQSIMTHQRQRLQIHVERIIVPVLHAQIGIGNKILKHFVELLIMTLNVCPQKKSDCISHLKIMMKVCKMQLMVESEYGA